MFWQEFFHIFNACSIACLHSEPNPSQYIPPDSATNSVTANNNIENIKSTITQYCKRMSPLLFDFYKLSRRPSRHLIDWDFESPKMSESVSKQTSSKFKFNHQRNTAPNLETHVWFSSLCSFHPLVSQAQYCYNAFKA